MLEFSISNQLLSRLDATKVMADSENYLECAFQFSADWEGTVAVATFGHSAVTTPISVRIVDGKCRVPHEVIKRYGFQVAVYGTAEDDEGTVCHIPTNTVTVEVEASGTSTGLSPTAPTKSLYDTLMSAISASETAAVAAKVSAESSAGVAMGAQAKAESALDSAKTSAAISAGEARNAQAIAEAVQIARKKINAQIALNKSYVLGSGRDAEVAHLTGLTWDENGRCARNFLGLTPGHRYRVKVNGVWRDVAAEWILVEREKVVDKVVNDWQAELFAAGRARVIEDDPLPAIPGGDEAVGGDDPLPSDPGGDDDDPVPDVPGGDEAVKPGTDIPQPPQTVVQYEVVKDIVKLVAGPLTIEEVNIDYETGEEGLCRIWTTDRTVTEVEIRTDGNDNAKYFYEQALAAAERAERAAERVSTMLS